MSDPVLLVFRPGQLGDSLICLPALHDLRRQYQDYRFVLLTDEYAATTGFTSAWEVYQPTNIFDDVIFYRPSRSTLRLLLTTCTLVRKIRRLSPAVIYSLAPDRTPAQRARDRFLFQKLCGVEACYIRRSDDPLTRGGNRVRVRTAPEWKQLLEFVHPGVTGADQFRLAIPAHAHAELNERLEQESILLEPPIIAVAPCSKMPAKRWPLERYFELGEQLRNRIANLTLAVVGGTEDRSVGDQLCDSWGGNSWNFAGMLSVYGMAAFMKRCDLYVGNDTGAMHLAAMAGVSCVAIFSARDRPGKWEPFGHDHVVLRHDPPCAGCMLEVCTQYDNRCLTAISVDQVTNAIFGLLESSGKFPVLSIH